MGLDHTTVMKIGIKFLNGKKMIEMIIEENPTQ